MVNKVAKELRSNFPTLSLVGEYHHRFGVEFYEHACAHATIRIKTHALPDLKLDH